MELIVDDAVNKVVIRKRKSMLGSGGGVGSKIQTSATPKSKDLTNCQVGLRKTIGSDTRYLLSFKNAQNRQVCKDIILTFNEQTYEQRITQAGDSIIIRPDRMHSQKKGLEIDTITISFGTPDLCDRWYAILQRLANEGSVKTVTKGGKTAKQRHSDEFEVEVERASSSAAVLVSSPKKKEKKPSNAYQTNPQLESLHQQVNQQYSQPTPLHQAATPSGTYHSLPQSQPIPMSPKRHSQLIDGAVDVNILVQAIKELQMQNLVLNQRVIALTQDVNYLKSLVPGGNATPQPVPTSPTATANPFLTNTTNYSPPQPQVQASPYAYNTNPAMKSINPFATNTSSF